jgi:hypothetical protein
MSTSASPRLRALFLLLALSSVPVLGCVDPFSAESPQGGDDASDENPGITGVPLDGAKDDGAKDGAPDSAANAHEDAQGDAQDATTEGGEPVEGAAQDTAEGASPVEAAAPDTGTTCASPNLECSSGCVPSDVHNCGTCGHDCTDLPHVSGPVSCTAGGACSFPPSSCAPGWAACGSDPDTGCETDLSQADHCGSCTTACSTDDPVCSGSGASYGCVSGCMAPTGTLCGGTCVDTTNNASYCGNCNTSCAGVTCGQPACAGSMCTFTCNNGYSACPTASPTECVDEQDDPGNCGACANICPPSTNGGGQPACNTGKCGLTCNAGLTACPVASPTECDDTTKDLDDCGSCGNECTTSVANASPTCQNSQCGFTCDGGYQECNGDSCLPVADGNNGAFVSPGASGNCTEGSPCGTIAAAIATGKTIIYLDQGTYTGLVKLPASTLTIHGGWSYSGGNWTNCNGTNATSVIAAQTGSAPGDEEAVWTSGSGTWTLDTLTIENASTPNAGQSLYGVFASVGSLTLQAVNVSVASGGDGGPLTGTGGSGASGAAAGSCAAGDGAAGATGADGTKGVGSYGVAGFESVTPGFGQTGAPGDNGTAAVAPTPLTIDSPCATGCENPAMGCTLHLCSCSGQTTSQGTTGENGCGGGGGSGGAPGNGGGASIGVFAASGASVTFVGASITTGKGGNGGDGQGGGGGGSFTSGVAGQPGPSSMVSCSNENGNGACTGCASKSGAAGAPGGNGGVGGTGGMGGGGVGGDSFCFASQGGGAPNGSLSCSAGAGGAGGNQGRSSVGATGGSGPHN